MAKQKIVVKVMMEDAKRRTRALKVAVGLHGVISAQVDGEKIVVVGDGVDSVELAVMLRRRMGFAEIVSVAAVEAEKKEEKKESKEDGASVSVQPVFWPYNHVQMAPQPCYYEAREGYNNDPCRMM